MERAILHLNITNFAASVEQALEPALRGRPVVITPPGQVRPLVYDMSHEAYLAGVRKGMPVKQACKVSRDLVFPRFRPECYLKAMKSIYKAALAYSPRVEASSGDGHLFMDLTGTHRLFGPAPDVAWRLRKELRRDLTLDPVWTLASNKLVAKVASRVVKPAGEYIIAPGEEAKFFAPLSIKLLPGLFDSEKAWLKDFNLSLMGQVAGIPLAKLAVIFNGRSRYIFDAVHGQEQNAVQERKAKTMQLIVEHNFFDPSNDADSIAGILAGLVEQLAFELRKRRVEARRVIVRIKYTDATSSQRQALYQNGTHHEQQLLKLANKALASAWKRRVRLRNIMVTVDRLVRVSTQLKLFDYKHSPAGKKRNLHQAIDSIRKKCGVAAIGMGAGK
jgi:DNA polymerase IV